VQHAGSRRKGRVVAASLGALLVAALSVFSLNAYAADEEPALNYVALGDSFSSGHGASFSYVDNSCRRSDSAYPKQFFDLDKAIAGPSVATFVNKACTGAKVADVLNDQLDALQPDTTLVTITIGGNDLNFAPVATTCVLGTSGECDAALNKLNLQDTSQLDDSIHDLLGKITERAPRADVFLLGYPIIFATGDCGALGISEQNRDLMTTIQTRFNGELQDAVKGVSARVGFLETDSGFVGHRVCDSESWINSVTDAIFKLDAGAAYHPNANGHNAIASKLLAFVSGGTALPG
jgi:lysophospholipase L1-like esterase